MLLCKEEIYNKRNRAAADVYADIEAFLKNGKYSSYRRANELSKMMLSGCKSKFMSERLGISEATLRNHIMRVSDDLYGLFGQTFFDKLASYSENRCEVDSVMYRVRHVDESAITYVLSDVLSAVRSQRYSYNGCSLDDCSGEIDFLRRYSHAFMEEAMGRLDRKKLAYLVDVLDGRAGTTDEWCRLVSTLAEEDIK